MIDGWINNFTKLKYHHGDYVLVPDEEATIEDVYDKIEVVRGLFIWAFPNSQVAVATIAPVNIFTYNEERNASEETLKAQTQKIIDDLQNLNHNIRVRNDECGVKTPYFHSNCIVKKNGRWRPIPAALVDGLHPSEYTEKTWMHRLHQCVDMASIVST